MEIKKNNHKFYVADAYSKLWFGDNKINRWEPDTFWILESYKTKGKGLYIDIGAWIGPTVLYAANIYDRIVAIEPDPVALMRLKLNMAANTFENITLIEKGLSSVNGRSQFGGNGDLGNSESTLLIANKEDYLSYPGRHTTDHKHEQVVEIDTITIETLIEEQQIDPLDISLIKMDIEGGEKIVVPAMLEFLKKYKPAFYISLHRCYLRPSEIDELLDMLFNIYDNCFEYSSCGNKKLIGRSYIDQYQACCLVFE
jgi:FkbM family methyltransferase